MLANFVKESVSAGGTGNLTLGGAETGHISFNTGVGVDRFFNYTIEDGNNREVGIGHLSASTTLVRDTVLETLVSGTLDRTSPATITVTTSATVSISATVESCGGLHKPGYWCGDGFAGQGTGMGLSTNTNSVCATGYLHMLPFTWRASQMMQSAAIHVHTAVASGAVRLALYEVNADGEPGKRLINFTETTVIDASTTGLKSQAADNPIFLPAGDYWFAIQTNDSTIQLKASQYSGAGLWLGAKSSDGRQINKLYRAFTYAEMPADEGASSWDHDSSITPWAFWVK